MSKATINYKCIFALSTILTWFSATDTIVGASSYQQLADRFAPIIYYPADEPNWPMPVDRFLSSASLNVYDADCSSTPLVLSLSASAASITSASYKSPCNGRVVAGSMRDATKRETIFLADVSDADKKGDIPSTWPTYYHHYTTADGETLIQYWFFYPYNTGEVVKIPLPFGLGSQDIQIGYHGGDWECMYEYISPTEHLTAVRFTGHKSLTPRIPLAQITLAAGEHPIAYALWGGHELSANPPDMHHQYTIRRETKQGGSIVWVDGKTYGASSLRDLGDKTSPQQPWLTYAGLWGSPGVDFVQLLKGLGIEYPDANISSGYWGPAFNETGRAGDGFTQAWCVDRVDFNLAVGSTKECYS